MRLRYAVLCATLLLGWAWSALAAKAADTPSATPETSSNPPSISEALTIPGWWVVGPFLTGVREAGVDPLAFDCAVRRRARIRCCAPSFPSLLVPGGEARWRYYKSGEDGALSVDYPEVTEAAMKLVTDEWGGCGRQHRGLSPTPRCTSTAGRSARCWS